MEITKDKIIEAMKAQPELISGVLPTIQESEIGKRFINTTVETEVNKQIGDKIREVHQKYDDDMFEMLGERPERGDDGSKEKSYQKIKNLYSELKDLRGQKDSLSKDEKVQALESKIQKLESEGPAKGIQQQFEQAKQMWKTEKEQLTGQIENNKSENEKFQKLSFINSVLDNWKFNPDTPETIRKMVINDAREKMTTNSQVRDGKLVFLKDDGSVELDKSTFEPIGVQGKLASLDSIRDISLKDESKGGNAKPEVGKVQRVTVEGKDAKKLNLSPGSFKTKSQFIEASEKAMLDAGITRRDSEWSKLQNEAYKEHNVKELPAE